MKFSSDILQAYFICGTQDLSADQDIEKVVKQALKAGITAFQFRDKGENSRLLASERFPLAARLHRLCQNYGVPFIVDDDVELARKVNAEGLHVGQKDQAIRQVVEEVGQDMFIGYSCSNLAEITKANEVTGLAYYGVGPIFSTNSKKDASPVVGVDNLKNLVASSMRPVVAIGGIRVEDLTQLAKSGVAGAAVISLITQSSDYQKTVHALLDAWPKK